MDINKGEKITEILGKIIVIVSLFTSFFVSGIYGLAEYGSIFNYSLFILFTLYVIMFLIFKRQDIKKGDYTLLCILALLLCNFITILLNKEKIFNLKIFIITAIQWLVVFYISRKDKTFIFNVLNIWNYLLFIITLYSLYLYVIGEVVTLDYLRFCGIYANTNMGSGIMVISIGISLLLFSNSNIYKKVFLMFNILVQILLIQLCMSRASTLMLFIIFGIFIVLSSTLLRKKAIVFVRDVVILFLCVVIAYFGFSKGIQAMHDMVKENKEAKIADQNKEAKVMDTNIKYLQPLRYSTETEAPLERNDQSQSNAIRLSMLKYGFMASLEHPLLGVGQKNVANVVTEKANYHFGGIDLGGVHNTYLQVAIANGYIGLMLFLLIQFLIFKGIIKKAKNLYGNNDKIKICQFSALTALYLGLLFYGLFESILILSSAIITYTFAAIAGGVSDEQDV